MPLLEDPSSVLPCPGCSIKKRSHPAVLSHPFKMAAPPVLPNGTCRCNTGNKGKAFSGIFLQFIDGVSRGTPQGHRFR